MPAPGTPVHLPGPSGMCGRFALTAEQEALSVSLGVPILVRDYRPRYNIAPSEEALALVQRPGRAVEVHHPRWGFRGLPAPGRSSAPLLINARSESVPTTRAFRDAWRASRRCLILADGFYEWSRGEDGRRRMPHWIQLGDGRPFGFAGLYEEPTGEGKGEFRFTILTAEANQLVAPIHDRMPVILANRDAWLAWVDPAVPPEAVRGLLAPFPSTGMRERPVGTYVNTPGHEGPACIEAAPAL